MLRFHLFATGCLVVAAMCFAQGRATPKITLFEGARLIAGDEGAPIENSSFLVENNRFTRVGKKGEIQAPAGTVRVDLTGKTVIPALIDGHSHIGYMRHLTSGAQNYTRENILDHLRRFAYFGVAASQSMGSDFGELPFEIREETAAGKHPDAARFLMAGRGLAPLVEISADNMRQAAYVITTEAGAKIASAKNDWGKNEWGGPCPPSGRHRYFFKVYALDVVASGDTKAELVKAIEGHVLAQGELVGTYQKKSP